MNSAARHAVHNGPTTNLANPVAAMAAYRAAADRAEHRADVAIVVAVCVVGLAVIVAGVWAAVQLFLT